MQANRINLNFIFFMKVITFILTLLFIILGTFFVQSFHLLAQELPTTCEAGRLVIDSSLFEVKDKSDKKVIFLLRRSKKEKNKVLKSRILIIKNFCENRGMKNSCVFGVSDLTDSLGKVEVYVNGELFRNIYYAENESSFCILE